MCKFCDRPSGSEEHLWPDWLIRFLLAEGILTTDGTWSANEFNTLGMEELRPIVKNIDVVVYCVCHTCNTRWMHKLEDRASPILKPIILGEHRVLSTYQQEIIARWAVKTALVLECRDTEHRGTSHAECAAFRLHQKIPESTMVWMCSYGGAMPVSHTRLSFKVRDDAGERDAWHTVFIIGKVVIEVFRDTKPNVNRTLSRERLNYCGPLFPRVAAEFPWAPDALTDADVGQFAANISGMGDALRDRLFPP